MKKAFDLVVIGEINPDLILSGEDVLPEFGQAEKLIDDARMTIGSSSAIMACGAARLGLKVALVGLVGDDIFGRFMLAALEDRGVNTAACVVDPLLSTGVSVILARPGDRAILSYPGTMPLLRMAQIDTSLLEMTRHIHVGSYFLLDALRPDLPALFRRARAEGLTTSLDTNWDPTGRWDVGSILPHVDLFFPNEKELLFITGEDDVTAALGTLAKQVPTLAVKLGAQGGLVRQGQSTVTVAALPIEVVDTTGAGDSFDAGFLYGQLNGYTLEASLALACACGSLSTRAVGGTDAQPTLAEAQAAIRRQSEALR